MYSRIRHFLSGQHSSSSIYDNTLIFVECDTDQYCNDRHGTASSTCDKTSGEPVCKCGTTIPACSGATPICVNDVCKGRVSQKYDYIHTFLFHYEQIYYPQFTLSP